MPAPPNRPERIVDLVAPGRGADAAHERIDGLAARLDALELDDHLAELPEPERLTDLARARGNIADALVLADAAADRLVALDLDDGADVYANADDLELAVELIEHAVGMLARAAHELDRQVATCTAVASALGGVPLVCTLPAGHALPHRDATGCD